MRTRLWVGLLLAVCSAPLMAHAAGGTSQIASKGQKVAPQAHWTKGLEAFLNHPARTDGWNGWFTEWPNDVAHYQFQVANTDEANDVLAKFAAIKSDKLRVRLSPGKEPGTIGWVSEIKPGNKTALLFTMGDQQRLDEWFAHLRDGKLGLMEFAKAPMAVPPTIVIYVENPAIDLDQLVIPANVQVEAGSLPGLFEEANLKVDPTRPAPKIEPKEPDAELKRVLERIDGYMSKRRKVS